VRRGEAAEEVTREGRAVGAYREGDMEEADGDEGEPTVDDLDGVGKIAS